MLEHVQDNPLGNKPADGKTSLAGIQDKIVLAGTADGLNRVIDGWPSTSIEPNPGEPGFRRPVGPDRSWVMRVTGPTAPSRTQ